MGQFRQQFSIPHPLSQRLAELRRQHFGERGRSEFARQLGIPVTSYIHYETDRTPPAELLVNAAELTGANLTWLLTGRGDQPAAGTETPPADQQQYCNELLQLLTEQPQLLPTARELLQLLRSMTRFQPEIGRQEPRRPMSSEGLIPVIGSTAAGTAHFWKELERDFGGSTADAELESLLTQLQSRSGVWSGGTTVAGGPVREPVALVQFAHPDEHGLLEFLSAAELKSRYPAAVAWRIDGDSMSPRYLDRDFVITSPQEPAVELHPCVARQQGQIGVNCKLFQTDGNDVLLIPVNDACPVQRFPRNQLLWAWRVLASVRLQTV